MATISGTRGTVKVSTTEILDVTGWELTGTAVTSRYASSSTSGFKKTIAGRKDQAGTIEAKWDSAGTSGQAPNTVLTEGQSVSLALIVDDSDDDGYHGTAVVKSFALKVDINDGAVTGCTIQFEADGQLTAGTP